MAHVHVAMLPSLLKPELIEGRVVAVFDVLRATTSLASACNNGAQVRVLPTLDAVRQAVATAGLPLVTAGEEQCVKPADFELGNSPAPFGEPEYHGRTIYFSTTNGTRALLACRGAARLFAGSIVNASATAAALVSTGLPITLVCSGTQGQVSYEDVLGCGAVMEKLSGCTPADDSALLAVAAWQQVPSLAGRLVAMHASAGGKHILAAGLGSDISFAAELDRIPTAVEVVTREGELIATCFHPFPADAARSDCRHGT